MVRAFLPLLVLLSLTACGARSGLDSADAAIDSAVPDAMGTGPRDTGAMEDCTTERCNGEDDDCDGLIDEGVSEVFFRDVDFDGFGGDLTVDACTPPAGFVANDEDCDDTNALVSPDGVEVCSGGLDEDCDGLTDCDDPDCACPPPPEVTVEEGHFFIGSPPSEAGREDDELRHEVSITRAFAIMSTEVTQGAWRELIGNEAWVDDRCGDDCPVDAVSWYEAIGYANRLSEAEGLPLCYDLTRCSGTLGGGCPGVEPGGWRGCNSSYTCDVVGFIGLDCLGYRLPTEAEWEYAARAGSNTAFPIGDDITRVSEIGWCTSSADRRIHPVAQLPANPWGLHDMAGNVYEWVYDHYADYPDSAVVDPLGPFTGRGNVIRGGSFAFGDFTCRSANRGARGPQRRETVVGFRLVRTLPDET